jgi:hypothetical protein
MPGQGLTPQYQAPEEGDLPSELQASVQRHREHLTALVTSLRSAGLPEEMIDASVESYGVELSAALRALRKDVPHA